MKQNPLFFSDSGKAIQPDDITEALRSVGLVKGDVVMVHSDLRTFGRLGDFKDRNSFLEAILNSFIEVIGSEGTLIVPTYTYSFCKKEIYDVARSPSTVGTFSEFVRTRPNALRTEDPIFSHAAIGKIARELTQDVSDVCFGNESLFDRIYKINAKIVNFGTIFEITFLHYIENQVGVGYRKDKTFSGTLIKFDGTSENKTVTYLVRRLENENFDVGYDVPKLGSELLKAGLLKEVKLGNSQIFCTHAQDAFTICKMMLQNNPYAVLTKDPNIIHLKEFPFCIGVLDSPDNMGLPLKLPITLVIDEDGFSIVQKYSTEIDRYNSEAYRLGSMVSPNIGQGRFGTTRANEVLDHLEISITKPIEALSFFEVGCADGYLLHQLQKRGAKKILGCEPGPVALEGSKKFGIEILNAAFEPKLISDKFNVIFSSGVLEHLHNPRAYLEQFKKCLAQDGTIFIAVPNCERKLRMGDISIVAHEHWNYFTASSLKALLESCGLTQTVTTVGKNQAFIYGWGHFNEKATTTLQVNSSETDISRALFKTFAQKLNFAIPRLQKRVQNLNAQGKKIGLYGGGLQLVGVLDLPFEPRFFDGDTAKHGRYLPGYANPIENPKNLLAEPIVDELWIAAIDYDSDIRHYLTQELRTSAKTEIFSIKGFLESLLVPNYAKLSLI